MGFCFLFFSRSPFQKDIVTFPISSFCKINKILPQNITVSSCKTSVKYFSQRLHDGQTQPSLRKVPAVMVQHLSTVQRQPCLMLHSGRDSFSISSNCDGPAGIRQPWTLLEKAKTTTEKPWHQFSMYHKYIDQGAMILTVHLGWVEVVNGSQSAVSHKLGREERKGWDRVGGVGGKGEKNEGGRKIPAIKIPALPSLLHSN